MIRTSYFGKLKRLGEFKPVAITNGQPYFFKGEHYGILGPPKDLLDDFKSGKINQEEYVIHYQFRILDKLDAKEVHDDLIKTYGDNVCLLCFERSDSFAIDIWLDSGLMITV